MKIGGIDPTTLPVEVFLVLPRGNQEIVFRARPVASMDEFEALCPRPAPPGKMTRDGWVPMDNDPTYQQVMSEWGQKRLGYMLAKSLEPSQVEWDTVNLADPSTWKNWSTDLRGGGLSDIECQRVMNLVLGGQLPGRGQAEEGPRGFSCWGGSESRILWPPHRTAEYSVWCACERLGILPPGVKPAWDDCGVQTQALIVAFDQTRAYDESEREARLLGARMPHVAE